MEWLNAYAAASTEVREYIGTEIRVLLDNPDFIEALPGFLLPDAASQRRRSLLEARLRALYHGTCEQAQ